MAVSLEQMIKDLTDWGIYLPLSASQEPFAYAVSHQAMGALTEGELQALLEGLPESAQKRSRLERVVYEPLTLLDHQPYDPTTIRITDVSDHAYESVGKVLAGWQFAHGLAHTIIDPHATLHIADRGMIAEEDFLAEYAAISEEYGPISRHSAAYWENGHPKSDHARIEELAEGISAYLLGFSYADDYARRRIPFLRAEGTDADLKGMLEQYLTAERVVNDQRVARYAHAT